MDTNEPTPISQSTYDFSPDPEELVNVLNTLTKITQKKLDTEEYFSPIVIGFYEINNKVASIPLLSDVPDYVWENPNLQLGLFTKAYEELLEEGLKNLAIVFPTIMYSIEGKSKVIKNLKKPLNQLTTSDYRALLAMYPEEVRSKMAVQYFVDINGEVRHAYAEISDKKQLSEFAVCQRNVSSPIPPILSAAREKVKPQ